MPRRQKKYHYIYKTTCLVTGKFYVGMHSTDDLDDGYLGSGKILGYSRKKHGDENHRKEILEMCPSRAALKQREKEIVNEELLADPLNINLKYGGEGGWDHIPNHPDRHSFLIKAGKCGGFANRTTWSPEVLARVSSQLAKVGGRNMTRRWVEQRSKMEQITSMARDSARSLENIEKRKRTFAEREHMRGTKNSQYGTRWVCKDGRAIKIKCCELQSYLDAGFSRGRK